jgi:hypothetical protein
MINRPQSGPFFLIFIVVELIAKIREILKKHYGEFDTYLENKYEEKMVTELLLGDSDKRFIWAVYNQVVLEVKNNLKDYLKVKELQYILTDDTDPRDNIIESIENIKEFTPELLRLYYTIKYKL